MNTTPDDEGLPRVADDNSSAYDTHDPNNPGGAEDSQPILPTDKPYGIDEYGVTSYEATHREPLDAKLRRELPDTSTRASTARTSGVGRLVAPDEGNEPTADNEEEEIARDSGEGDGLSAEEAAMHPVRSQDVPYRKTDSYLDS